MKTTQIRPPYTDKKGNIYEFKLLDSSNSKLIEFIYRNEVDLGIASKYLIAVEKQRPEDKHPLRNLGFKNDSDGYLLCSRDKENKNPKGFYNCCSKQSITSFIQGESNTITIFYDFWDFLSYLSLYPEKEGQNFIILNRHSKHDHNLSEAKLIAGRFATVENYVKWDNSKNEEVQQQLEEVCSDVIPRWRDFDELNLNEYLKQK
jgi:hypothetical protein